METSDIVRICFIFIGYFMGSIPTGDLIGRFYAGVDVFKEGSESMGGANVLRTTGKVVYGASTILFDALVKGWLMVYITQAIFDRDWIVPAVFAAVLLGHVYPVFTKFKGGKGIATLIGGLFVLVPWAIFLLLFFFAWIPVFNRSKGQISLTNVFTVSLLLLVCVAFNPTWYFAVFIAFAGFLTAFAHRSNLKRVWHRKESRLVVKINWTNVRQLIVLSTKILSEENFFEKFKEYKPIDFHFVKGEELEKKEKKS